MYGEKFCHDVHCLKEQLLCCELSCLDVVHFIVKKTLLLMT